VSLKPSIRQSVVRKLIRKMGGVTERTNSLESLSPEVRNEIECSLLGRDVSPIVLASFMEVGRWTAVTPTHLIWNSSGDVHALPWGAIETVMPPQDAIESIIMSPDCKLKQEELEVVDRDGGRHYVFVEAGEPFILMWNVLQALGR
jgi:hypothetical protein